MSRDTDWWTVIPRPRAEVNINSAIRLSRVYEERLGRTPTARYLHPARLDAWQTQPLAVRNIKTWQDYLDNNYFGMTLSERMAAIFSEHANDCQALELNVRYQSKPSLVKYFIVNVFRYPDCLNYTKSKVRYPVDHWDVRIENIDFDVFGREADPVIIDPTRIPKDARVIVPKHTYDIFLHDEVAQQILKLNPTGMKLVPAQVSVETPAERAKVMRALAAVRRKWEPRIEEAKKLAALSLSEALGIAIPPACEAQLREFAGTIRKHGEVFDLREMMRETQSMRKATDILWPHHFICVGNDGRGGVFAVDTSKGRTDSGPVVYSDHELMQEHAGQLVPHLEHAADSLADWVAKNCPTPKLR